ncbi:conserved hypothetical protein [Burkholderia pseudomallei Pakistan 9]|nr:conserved hypothetical protein [Burkholderia pseudomallei Pakistan 9]EXI98374.1 hypothetical protein T210_0134185 [Burkholderia pseudomallei MSHR6137]
MDAEAAGRNGQRIILALRRPAGSASPRSGLADRMRKKPRAGPRHWPNEDVEFVTMTGCQALFFSPELPRLGRPAR